MDIETRRAMRYLKAYAFFTTSALVVIALAAFRNEGSQPGKKQHFGEIDVERINIVEKDGTPRLIFSNKARFPGIIYHGKEYPHPSRRAAGMLWFNDEGTENGGLTAGAQHDSTGVSADGILTFDQYDQDQTVALRYDEQNGRRSAGLQVWDRPNYPLGRLIEVLGLPNGPVKTQRLNEFKQGNATRLFAGKTENKASVVQLSDPQGRPRLRLVVDSLGTARVEFLDANGAIFRVTPAK